MTDFRNCPTCGSKVAVDHDDVDRPSQCEKCGSFVSAKSAAWNPYDAPSSALGQGDEGPLAAIDVPSSVFGKFGLAFRLFAENLVLYSLINLTIWLPGNLAIAYLASEAPAGKAEVVSGKLNLIVQGLLGPISLGALIFAIAKRLDGEPVGYLEAMRMGFANWGRMFLANLIAGLFIILGFFCFVVPGIILSIRYSLVGPVVVLERSTPPRQRSSSLTVGRRWKIFGAGSLFYGVFLASSFSLGITIALFQEQVEWLDSFWVDALTSCVLHVCGSILTILLVLFYAEARADELASTVDRSGDFEIDTRMSEAL